ncbi:MAG: Gfo/Idh/MocA family protein [Candidatus Brocadiia bacterium]
MAQQVRLGFIGCGGNARGHMTRVAEDLDVTIAGVCDVAEAAARSAAADFGAQPFTSHKAMLDAGGLDAVYISIPVFAHGEPELDVLDAGLPFFVEKPVAISLDVARRIASRVRETDALTCVGYQLRYTRAARDTRAFLADETIGMAVGRYWCGTGRGTGWLREFQKSGGQVVEQATHTIDMMRFLCGEIAEVYSVQANRTLGDIDCPDHTVTAMTFASGAPGCLTTCWAYEGFDGNVVDVFFDRYRLNWAAGGPTTVPECPQFAITDEPTQSIDEVFLHAVRTGDRRAILTPYDDAVRSLAVSLAANDSARDGAPKPVPAL